MKFLALLLLPLLAHADPLQVKAVDVEYRRFLAPGQDAVIYPREHQSELNFRIDVQLYKLIYFDSKIVSESDAGQFRMVGLHLNYGVHLSRYLDVEYMHKSEHILDAPSIMPGYPLYDAIGAVIHLVPRN